MPATKNAVTTPLHLLQQLSKSLVEHLEKACTDAQKDAELLLAKLEKQRGKTQEKLVKTRAKLDEAGNAGKSKAQSKARSKLTELDDMLALLQTRQSETLSYLADLKRDAEQSLNLAQGVTQVEKAAAQALASRGKATPSRSASAQRKAAPAATKPGVTRPSATKPATTKPAPTRQSSSSSSPAASKPAATTRTRSVASKDDKSTTANASGGPAAAASSAAKRPARPASGRAKPKPTTTNPSGAAKPAATRKPASTKTVSADQPAPPAPS
ncbi:AlgP family protein [Stutzerimonas xanthomarina]|uniref:AlgP family protein n=1 Tax=Stutzerimonas xanthomarina TaxID=271420 RepID=UPI003AA91525